MSFIRIAETSSYLPQNEIFNDYFNTKFALEKDWIYKRTGIKKRYFSKKEESIVDLCIEVSNKILKKINFDKQEIGNIIITSTTTDRIMPGISFEIQKALDIKKCMCFDILAGCSGYINAIDIARKNLLLEEIKYSLVIGVEKLSEYLDFDDLDTSILLGDGAGAILLEKVEEKKEFFSHIISIPDSNRILTCNPNEKISMDGKAIYKFAVTETSKNIKELLEKSNEKLENIKYIIPHQSNIRILNSIADKVGFPKEKLYTNLENVGNTFCASIPIAIDEMFNKKLLNKGDKIIIVGYGGGLNLGSLLLEI